MMLPRATPTSYVNSWSLVTYVHRPPVPSTTGIIVPGRIQLTHRNIALTLSLCLLIGRTLANGPHRWILWTLDIWEITERSAYK